VLQGLASLVNLVDDMAPDGGALAGVACDALWSALQVRRPAAEVTEAETTSLLYSSSLLPSLLSNLDVARVANVTNCFWQGWPCIAWHQSVSTRATRTVFGFFFMPIHVCRAGGSTHQVCCYIPQAGRRGALVLRCRACAAAGLPLRLVLLLTRLAQPPAANGASPRGMVRRRAVLHAQVSGERLMLQFDAAPIAMETCTGHSTGCLEALQMQEAQFTVQLQSAEHSTLNPCMVTNHLFASAGKWPELRPPADVRTVAPRRHDVPCRRRWHLKARCAALPPLHSTPSQGRRPSARCPGAGLMPFQACGC
jgi:hypothetical protein